MGSNSFTPSYSSHIGKMGSDMKRFFGGDQLQNFYKDVFQPIYSGANSFSPTANSFAPDYDHMAGQAVDGFSASYSTPSGSDQFSRFRPQTDNVANQFVHKYLMSGSNAFQNIGTGSEGGTAAVAGGDWSALDAHNKEINSASSAFGVPSNLLKSMINNESSGNWLRDGYRYTYLDARGYNILPFVGMTDPAVRSLGLDPQALIGDKQGQINAMAMLVKRLADQYGGFDNAIKVYFRGEQALSGDIADENGLSSNNYYAKALNNWHYLDGLQGGNSYQQQYGQGGTANVPQKTQSVLSSLQQYLGTPYVWGSAPGKGANPSGGWDCSGMTWWLDQNFGDGSLPQGSHEQYAHAQNTGKLFTDTQQLQPGDLMFFNTGFSYRGNAASHVGVYLGNGKMIEAANPDAGTIISDVSGKVNQPGYYMGAMHQSFSGGSGGMIGGAAGAGQVINNPNIFQAKLGPGLMGGMPNNAWTSWQSALTY